MKIAVASEGKEESSSVSEVSGRAPYYLIFEDKKLAKVMKNPFAVGGGGAGFGVVQMLHNEGVGLVISGKFGPNMVSAFKEKNIKFLEVEGSIVSDAVNMALSEKD